MQVAQPVKFCAAMVGCAAFFLGGCGQLEGTHFIQRTLHFSISLKNTSQATLRESAVEVFVPVRELANQRTGDVSSLHPHELIVDTDGNQKLRFRMTIPPWGREIVRIRADVRLAALPNPTRLRDRARYLEASRLIQVSDPSIQSIAQSLPGHDSLSVARSSYEWVIGNLSDSGLMREERGAVWALEQRAGDCTEQAFLFSALARARGIPTRVVAGFAIDGDAVVHASDYHNWAEFYADGAWRISDPHGKNFDAGQDRYVVMRIVDPGGGSASDARRFAAFDPRLEVRMN